MVGDTGTLFIQVKTLSRRLLRVTVFEAMYVQRTLQASLRAPTRSVS